MKLILIRIKMLIEKRANTLVEVIISMLIIGIAAALLSSGIMTAMNFYQRGNDILHNLADAEETIENRIADMDNDEIQEVKISYEVNGVKDRIYINMSVIRQPLGINADLKYYLY